MDALSVPVRTRVLSRLSSRLRVVNNPSTVAVAATASSTTDDVGHTSGSGWLALTGSTISSDDMDSRSATYLFQEAARATCSSRRRAFQPIDESSTSGGRFSSFDGRQAALSLSHRHQYAYGSTSATATLTSDDYHTSQETSSVFRPLATHFNHHRCRHNVTMTSSASVASRRPSFPIHADDDVALNADDVKRDVTESDVKRNASPNQCVSASAQNDVATAELDINGNIDNATLNRQIVHQMSSPLDESGAVWRPW